MNKKRVFTFLLSLLIILSSLASCKGNDTDTLAEANNVNQAIDSEDTINSENITPDGENEGADTVSNNVENPENSNEDSTEEITEEPEPEPEKIINKLTGIEISPELSNQRPVAIMFNNINAALPQIGISAVDILYEITVEGAITRLMGVATDWASLPTVGSVRSSRDYFIDISDAHNAIYVHAGGSDYAYSELWARGTERIDGTNGTRASGAAFYRDPERMKKMAIEHTLVTNGERLAKAISENNFSTVYKENFNSPLKFSKKEMATDGVISASYVYLPFSYYAQSYLDYDSSTGLYKKGQYLGTKSSLDKHDSPHIDGTTGKQLEFKNIVVLFAPHSDIPGDTKGRIKVDITGVGNGYYISNGQYKKITWEKETRTSSYTLYDVTSSENDEKTELLLNPGKTYVAIVPTTAEIVIK